MKKCCSMGCGNPMNLKDGEESYQECQESFTNHGLTITDRPWAEVTMVLKVGLMCSNDEPSSRPNMRQVIRYLEREAPVLEIVGPSCDQHAPALVKLKSL
uniref:Uncharacterized protein n=1 Tax=Helianthus annuus TaxID=4232 RepID=A0A251SAN7_HELAN